MEKSNNETLDEGDHVSVRKIYGLEADLLVKKYTPWKKHTARINTVLYL